MQTEPALKQCELQNNDVLCTKDKTLRHHPGNCFFRAYIDKMLPTYKQAKCKLEKMNITKTIVDELQMNHGIRFVKFDEETTSWVEVDDLTAREKVGHAIRFAMRREEKQAIKATNKKSNRALRQLKHVACSVAESSSDESSSCEMEKCDQNTMEQHLRTAFCSSPSSNSCNEETANTAAISGACQEVDETTNFDFLLAIPMNACGQESSDFVWTVEDANFLLNQTGLFQNEGNDHHDNAVPSGDNNGAENLYCCGV
ncbi:hypothetical protein ACA910_002940 [Epithemia clementina (nom. ined.)]